MLTKIVLLVYSSNELLGQNRQRRYGTVIFFLLCFRSLVCFHLLLFSFHRCVQLILRLAIGIMFCLLGK